MPVVFKTAQLDAVRAAIIATFPFAHQLQDALPQVMKDAELEADHFLKLPPGIYQYAAWQLVRTWNAHGVIADLIGGLLRIVPTSPSLRTIQQQRLKNFPAGETAQLQGFVTEALQHVPAAEWLVKFAKRMSAVCRVDFNGWDPPGVGTGFLVRPDLVLTAHHVIEKLPRQELLAQTAVCRFEYLNDIDKKGTVVPFSQPQWKVAISEPGGIEKFPGGAEPTADELDFALVRLEEPIATEPLPIAQKAAAADDLVIVLQHPRRVALRMAFGQVTGFNAGGTRLRHNAGTETGSSGAPCLNYELEVVGLHNATRYPAEGPLAEYNTAVPIQRIGQTLAAKTIQIGGDST